MKRASKIATQVLLGGLTVLTATTALAQSGPREDGTFFGYEARGKWMVGIKAAKVQNSEADFGDATNVGFLFGYTFARPIGINGTAAIEFEGTGTASDGDIGPESNLAAAGTSGEWDVDTLAIFFAYRTPGVVYFKGKLGGMQSKVSAKLPGGNVDQDDFSFAYGAGLGVRLGTMGRIEAEYTGASGDNDIGLISLGGILEF